jgi:hypothetical protein
MRRVWVAVLTVWALVAMVAVLAWAHGPSGGAPTSASQAVVVKGANGSSHVVLVPAGGVHGTTQTSPGAGGSPISLVQGGAVSSGAVATGAGAGG